MWAYKYWAFPQPGREQGYLSRIVIAKEFLLFTKLHRSKHRPCFNIGSKVPQTLSLYTVLTKRNLTALRLRYAYVALAVRIRCTSGTRAYWHMRFRYAYVAHSLRLRYACVALALRLHYACVVHVLRLRC